MIKPTKVERLTATRSGSNSRMAVKGEADLSRHSGKGLFKAWDDREIFNSVRIDAPYRALIWADSVRRLHGIDGYDRRGIFCPWLRRDN